MSLFVDQLKKKLHLYLLTELLEISTVLTSYKKINEYYQFMIFICMQENLS